MALKNVLFTGDTHGHVEFRLASIQNNMPEYKPEETAVIILGDCGINYYLNKTDQKHKRQISAYGYTIYCVRGNHEARPKDIPTMKMIKDDFVDGIVWIEDEFPLIRYFCDWGFYNIQGRETLVMGGAYSVDKYYRLVNGLKWFENEQMPLHERDACLRNAKDKCFNLVLSHTCPYSLRPEDLFLGYVDQSTVDNTMELWLEEVKNSISFGIWLWGHYHADRIEAPYCEMFFEEVEDLKTIEERWKRYRNTGELDWWLPKGQKFYMYHKEKKNEE